MENGSGEVNRDEMGQEEAGSDSNPDGYGKGQEYDAQHSVLADLKQKAGQVPQPRRDSSYRRQEVL